ncbi:MAG: hypothetical protein DHS20C09_11160 [marine bacterium B5-7]|nr:MAG: hypothetical protein DHS20C09_11160 [marine bacterium B5-7]
MFRTAAQSAWIQARAKYSAFIKRAATRHMPTGGEPFFSRLALTPFTRLYPGNTATVETGKPFPQDRVYLDNDYQPAHCILHGSFPSNSPLAELAIARHENKSPQLPFFNDIISMVLVLRVGTAMQVYSRHEEFKCASFMSWQHMDDHRPRLMVTKNCRDPKERQRLFNFVAFVESFNGPFDKDSVRAIESLLDPENKQGIVSEDIPLKDKRHLGIFVDSTAGFKLPKERYICFDPYQHLHMPTELSEIHQKVWDGDEERVKALLAETPRLSLAMDAWGRDTMQWIMRVGTPAMFDAAFEAYERVADRNWVQLIPRSEYWKLRADGLAPDNPRAHPRYRSFFHPRTEEEKEKCEQKRAAFLLPLGGDTPFRDPFHQACAEGNLPVAFEVLKKSPERIWETDIFGFSVFLLALVSGSIPLVRKLCDLGFPMGGMFTYPDGTRSGIKPVSGFGSTSLLTGGEVHTRVLDHVHTPALMEHMLYLHRDASEYQQKLSNAIRLNNIPLVDCMLGYAHFLQTDGFLTPLELALRCSHRHGTGMVEVILKHMKVAVPEGPYDHKVLEFIAEKAPKMPDGFQDPTVCLIDIPEAVQACLEAHNEIIKQRLSRWEKRPQLQRTYLRTVQARNSIVLELGDEKNRVHAEIKQLCDLTSRELEQIQALFFRNFECVTDNSEVAQKAYMEAAFQQSSGKESYVQLFRSQGDNIVSFMTFDLESARFEEESFFIFHARLAANNPAFTSLGLTEVAFSNMLALKTVLEDSKILCFFKAIPPGYALCMMPDDLNFYPKWFKSGDLVRKIGEVVGDDIADKGMSAKLRVKPDRVSAYQNQQLAYFRHFTEKTQHSAMPVVFEVQTSTVGDYLNMLKYNGIGEKQLETLALTWASFRGNLPMPSYQVKPRL